VQTGLGAHSASYKTDTWSFSGVKRPGRGVDHPLPISDEVKEKVELYLYSPFGPYGLNRNSVPVQRCTLTLTLTLPFIVNVYWSVHKVAVIPVRFFFET